MPALLLAGDFALRLTAVETLRALVDAWSFVLDAFAPAAVTIIHALYSVVAAADDFDTRLQTMDLLGKVSAHSCYVLFITTSIIYANPSHHDLPLTYYLSMVTV